MSVQVITISDLRNLRAVKLEGLSQVNLFCGENGAGKTSVLEAVHMLGVTRSFRSHRMDTVINADSDSALVSGRVSTSDGITHRIGVQRSRRERPLVKVDGEAVQSLGDLAGLLPLQVINSDSFQLLEGSPQYRRQLLDWGVFHVEHERFYSLWQRYSRALKQRNALLRRGKMDRSQLRFWDGELALCGEALEQLRRAQHQRLSEALAAVYASLQQEAPAFSFDYYAGWDSNTPLADELAANIERDLRLGYTRSGPHRADIRVRVGSAPAAEILSRGQTKTLVCAARIAQAKLLQEYGINSVFLIDDLPAELDREHRRRICNTLSAMGVQLFVTSIGAAELDDCWDSASAIKRFHVEHGRVTPAAA